jgi:hypothetical protein
MYYSNNCELILRTAHKSNKRWQIPFFSIIIIIKKKRFVGGCAIQFFSDLSGLSFEMLDLIGHLSGGLTATRRDGGSLLLHHHYHQEEEEICFRVLL